MKKLALFLAVIFAISIGIAAVSYADCLGGTPDCPSVSGTPYTETRPIWYPCYSHSDCVIVETIQSDGIMCQLCFHIYWYSSKTISIYHQYLAK